MNRYSRRKFLGTLAASTSITMVGGSFVGAIPVGERKIRFAQIGCGGRGRALSPMWRDHDFVAAVDTNSTIVDAFNPDRFPNLQRYSDCREMYANQLDDIDAVIVATSDHTHFAAAMPALKAGKAVYCEKPLAWAMQECFEMARVAEKLKVPTQMGNQGNGMIGWRQAYSIVHQGLIGDVIDVHNWTNRPIWPQGHTRPDWESPVPDNLDWESWIGPAEMVPYVAAWPRSLSGWSGANVYTPQAWRGWYDFGCGAMGDMACHTMNVVFQTMKPDYNFTVEPVHVEGRSSVQYPQKEIVKWTFAKSGDCPGFDAYWYDGNLKPDKPEEMGAHNLPGTGVMLRGSKGVLVIRGDYNENSTIYIDGEVVSPEYEMLIAAPKHDIQQEFVAAIKGELEWDQTVSNFMYSGKMSAIVAAGTIAERLDRKLRFSADTMKFDDDQANALIRRTPRSGWEAAYDV